VSARPSVSVIVPFAGPATALATLTRALGRLRVADGDEILVADNRAAMTAADPSTQAAVRVVTAGGVAAPGFARNRAAILAAGEWLLFLDADTEPAGDLLDRYFDAPPAPSTAVLAGAIVDRAGGGGTGRFAAAVAARRPMDQEVTLRRLGTPYAQTANCAVRRAAFEAIGGFDESARWGEDADLCFRLARAGWETEERPAAVVVHRSRATAARWLAQLAGHGAGAAWLDARYPGSFPPAGARALAARLVRSGGAGVRAVRSGRSAEATTAALEMAGALAFELGRRRSNRPPSSIDH
jgi:GT2 family glycosyltransferase